MPMIIDAHTHLFPPEAARDPRGWATARGEAHWLGLVAPAKGPSRQGWATAEEMLAGMDREGIDKAVVQNWYWESHDTVRETNEWLLAETKPWRDRLIPFAALQPGRTTGRLVEEAQQWRDRGFAGFGELSAAAQGFRLGDQSWREFAAWAEEENVPVCLHVNEPVAHPRFGWKPEILQDYLEFVVAFPRLPVILAHLGGLLPIYAANRRVARKLRGTRVMFDTAALPLLYDQRILQSLDTEEILPRLVFGSDYPLLVNTPPASPPSWQPTLDYLRSSGLSASFLTRIFGKNFPNGTKGSREEERGKTVDEN